mgnify:CR=1 FL=1
MNFLKRKNFSVTLSLVLVRIVFALIIVSCFIGPYIVKIYDQGVIKLTGQSVFVPLIVTLYCSAVPATLLVIALDRLISNIKRGDVFTAKNVTMLRVISYCCFAASVIFIYFSFIRPFAWLIVAAAAFFGLILRVIKNVFEQAIEIKEENDFTI